MNEQNPPPKSIWPYAIIAYFVCFIGVVAAFITFAVKQDVHLVRPDYYSAEIRYQEQIDRISRTDQLGRQVAIEYSAKHRKLGVQLPPTHEDATGEVKFYRPNNPGLDRSVALQLENNNRQYLDTKDLANGSWRVELKWRAGGVDYFKSQKIVVFNPPS